MNRLRLIFFSLVFAVAAGMNAQWVLNNQVPCSAASVTVGPNSVTCITNTTTNFTVTAGGTYPFYYQWQTNGVNAANVAGYSGATAATFWVSNVVIAQSNYAIRCLVTNACGSATSGVATLTVTNGVAPGATYFLSENFEGTNSGYDLTLWQEEKGPQPNVSSFGLGMEGTNACRITHTNGNTWAWRVFDASSNLVYTQLWFYCQFRLGEMESSDANMGLAFTDNTGTIDYFFQRWNYLHKPTLHHRVGGGAVEASTNSPYAINAGVTYNLWMSYRPSGVGAQNGFGSLAISTNSTPPTNSTSDGMNIFLAVTNGAGSNLLQGVGIFASANAATNLTYTVDRVRLSTNEITTAPDWCGPLVTLHPESKVFAAGVSTNLSCQAIGTSVQYLWYKTTNTACFSTSNTLVFTNFQSADAGSYYCLATNAWATYYSLTSTVELAAGGFGNPSNYNPIAWYDSDELVFVTNTTAVIGWGDKSGSGNNLTNAGSTPFVAGTTNIYTSSGAGSLYRQTLTQGTVSQPITMFFVGYYDGGTSWRFGTDGYSSSVNRIAFLGYNDAKIGVKMGVDLATAAAVPDGLYVFTLVFNGSSSSIRTNGTEVAAGNAGSDPLAGLRVGCNDGGTQVWEDDIREIILYTNLTSISLIQNVENWLKSKHGL